MLHYFSLFHSLFSKLSENISSQNIALLKHALRSIIFNNTALHKPEYRVPAVLVNGPGLLGLLGCCCCVGHGCPFPLGHHLRLRRCRSLAVFVAAGLCLAGAEGGEDEVAGVLGPGAGPGVVLALGELGQLVQGGGVAAQEGALLVARLREVSLQFSARKVT